jgi:hypothetical protein
LLALAVAASPVLAAKPGYPDRITWSGETWSVKTSRSAVGPGPNMFAKENVTVDAAGDLHLAIRRNAAGTWTSAEIIGPRTYGYGTYTFRIQSRLDTLDRNVVLGLFTWSDRALAAHREIDIEFARWGNAADPTNAQYVLQPHEAAGHLDRFTQPSDTWTTHEFTWRPGEITWRSTRADGTTIDQYTYKGSDVPTSRDERVRLNLWLFGGQAPSDGQPVEVVVSSFRHTP